MMIFGPQSRGRIDEAPEALEREGVLMPEGQEKEDEDENEDEAFDAEVMRTVLEEMLQPAGGDIILKGPSP